MSGGSLSTPDPAPVRPLRSSLPAVAFDSRPRISGKFVACGGEKFYARGVTYGTFRPDEAGGEFPLQGTLRDFAQMAANGINAVRTYTVPPRWFLDAAQTYGLRVMVGIPWEQHITFLDDPGRADDIEKRVSAAVRSCAGHPAVLCFVIGNEIPASIVRWHGARRIEAFLERLYRAAKSADPGSLVTYVNYPTTEYLNLPFLDLVCFNVYLESREQWEAYLARLQNIAGERPLLLAEVGLDSRRNGEEGQAQTLDWLVQSAFAKGFAGTFVFAWTDEWHRGGYDIENWDFGLTRRDRTPKPALEAIRRAYMEVPFAAAQDWPSISVVVCTYNGHRLIRDTLEGLARLRYPNYQVIVIDDGSSPPMDPIVQPYGFQTIRTSNQGLSAARNVGMEAATGEIIAYLDDDAYPDPDWLTYLAKAFAKTTHVGIGGPNIAPEGDGRIAHCIANAPGGPVHVLLSDEVAEHIPGCNMAFRRDALRAAGGFDVQFRVAGDDVDLCWRLQELGGTLGYCPGAMVWHHRRNSIRTYWKQQSGYGRAEALLARKWPSKYNRAGQSTWAGRIYGRGLVLALGGIRRIYHGTWGDAPFQSLYQTGPNALLSVLLMPEWYGIVGILGLLGGMGHFQGHFQLFGPAFLMASAAPLLQAWRSSRQISHSAGSGHATLRLCTALLYLIQPVARMWGRSRPGISRSRRREVPFRLPRPARYQLWTETWIASKNLLEEVESAIRSEGLAAVRGGPFDKWDLEIPGGLLGSCRVQMAVEEHGAGRQLFRFRLRPCTARSALLLGSLITAGAGAAGAAISQATEAFGVLALAAASIGFHAARQCGAATAAVDRAIRWCQKLYSAAPSSERIEIQALDLEREALPPVRAQLERMR